MLGNVWEWLRDDFDPEIPTSKVIRGGGYDSGASENLQEMRSWNTQTEQNSSVGFRVVLEPDSP